MVTGDYGMSGNSISWRDRALRAEAALPICPRCNRREPRLDYCAGCDREMCQTCHRDHKECAE